MVPRIRAIELQRAGARDQDHPRGPPDRLVRLLAGEDRPVPPGAGPAVERRAGGREDQEARDLRGLRDCHHAALPTRVVPHAGVQWIERQADRAQHGQGREVLRVRARHVLPAADLLPGRGQGDHPCQPHEP